MGKDDYTPTLEKNGWNAWAKYVLETLKTNNKKIEGLEEKLNDIKISIEVIKTKMQVRAGLIGAIAGFLPAVTLLIYFLIRVRNGT